MPTSASAAFPTNGATANVRYKKFGRIVFFEVVVNISSNGSASGTVNVAMPYYAAADNAWGGRNFTNGLAIAGVMVATGSTLALTNFDGSYPGGSGQKLVISGFYEANL